MMNSDVQIKLILAVSLCFMYAVVFLTQKLDLASVSALMTGFTNALVGIFTYNYTKRRYEQVRKRG